MATGVVWVLVFLQLIPFLSISIDDGCSNFVRRLLFQDMLVVNNINVPTYRRWWSMHRFQIQLVCSSEIYKKTLIYMEIPHKMTGTTWIQVMLAYVTTLIISQIAAALSISLVISQSTFELHLLLSRSLPTL